VSIRTAKRFDLGPVKQASSWQRTRRIASAQVAARTHCAAITPVPIPGTKHPLSDFWLHGRSAMRSRFTQIGLVLVLMLLATIAAQPYLERVLFASTSPRSIDPRGSLSDVERSTIAIFERVSPSVVQVAARTASVGPLVEDGGGRAASGTGFIWDGAGHVVTNDHVVQGSKQVAVRLSTGEVAEAELVGLAPNYDLAVIRIKGARGLPSPSSLGSSADLKVGQAALAIGNPFGLDQSLSTGIISALNGGCRQIADAKSPTSSRRMPLSTREIPADRFSIRLAGS
jgi:hypothetical protein